MSPADQAAAIRAFVARLVKLDEPGGNGDAVAHSLYDEMYKAGIAREAVALLKREAPAYADHDDALQCERRDRIVRIVE